MKYIKPKVIRIIVFTEDENGGSRGARFNLYCSGTIAERNAEIDRVQRPVDSLLTYIFNRLRIAGTLNAKIMDRRSLNEGQINYSPEQEDGV